MIDKIFSDGVDSISLDLSIVDEIFGVLLGFSIYKVFIDSPELYSLLDKIVFVGNVFIIIMFAVSMIGIFSVGSKLMRHKKRGALALFLIMLLVVIDSFLFVRSAVDNLRSDNFYSIRLAITYSTIVWMSFKLFGQVYEVILLRTGHKINSLLKPILLGKKKKNENRVYVEFCERTNNSDLFDISIGPPI